MKIKIDKNGFLHIERAGQMKGQDCPYASRTDYGTSSCGDWCPHFKEPHLWAKHDNIEIKTCKASLSCATADFTDERNTQES